MAWNNTVHAGINSLKKSKKDKKIRQRERKKLGRDDVETECQRHCWSKSKNKNSLKITCRLGDQRFKSLSRATAWRHFSSTMAAIGMPSFPSDFAPIVTPTSSTMKQEMKKIYRAKKQGRSSHSKRRNLPSRFQTRTWISRQNLPKQRQKCWIASVPASSLV